MLISYYCCTAIVPVNHMGSHLKPDRGQNAKEPSSMEKFLTEKVIPPFYQNVLSLMSGRKV